MSDVRVPYPFTTEYMPLIADHFVDTVYNIDGVRLDYSIPSITYIDELIDSWRDPSSPMPESSLLTAGVYAGECMRLDVQGRWAYTSEVPVKFSPWTICLYTGADYCDPIGKAFKRYDLGRNDSLAYFAHVFLSKAKSTGSPNEGGPPTS